MFENRRPITALLIVVLAALACNTPIAATQVPAPIGTAAPVAAADTPTPETAAHTAQPADPPGGGELYYDAESKSTSAMGYAPYGEIYKFNRFERPFTQDARAYLPAADINKFRMTKDSAWYYAVITLIGPVPTDDSAPDYGVELDLDLDGRGDVLIWADPPYTNQWSNDNLQVFEDPNNDVGGVSPVAADLPPGGDGFEKLILDHAKGADPDLAYVRISPTDATTMQFAFKRVVAAQVKGFLWNAWADQGLRDVTKFNYNDHFTKAEAGSSLKDEPEFPPKAIYAMDNTCRLAFDFIPNGYEPLLCPPLVQPTEPNTPKPGPTSAPTSTPTQRPPA